MSSQSGIGYNEATLRDQQVPANLQVDKTSPTYNYRDQSNLARIGEAIPVPYGKNRIYPDLIIKPWRRSISNNVLSHQLFLVGQGEYDIESISFGNVNIQDTNGVIATIVQPFETFSQFSDNVFLSVSESAIELPAPNEVSASGNIKFDQNKRRIRLPNSNLQSFLSVGDEIEIADTTNYNGTYFVESVEDPDTIVVTDASTWPENVDYGFHQLQVATKRMIPDAGQVFNVLSLRPYSIIGVSSWFSEATYVLPLALPVLYPGSNTQIDSVIPGVGELRFLDGVSSTKNPRIIRYSVNRVETSGEGLGYRYDRVSVTSSSSLYSSDYTYKDVECDYRVANIFKNQNPAFQVGYGKILATGANRYAAPNLQGFSEVVTLDAKVIEVWSTESGSLSLSDSPIEIVGAVGPFFPQKSGLANNNFEIDIQAPDGVYSVDGNGNNQQETVTFDILYRERGSADSFEVVSNSISLGTPREVNLTFPIEFLDEREYEVYLHRTSNKNLTSGNSTIVLNSLKSFYTNVGKYGNVTLISVQLNASALPFDVRDSLSLVCTRKLPKWNGIAWEPPSVTRNPVWALADIWMSYYGFNRSYINIDLNNLLTLEAIYDARGDKFDGIFDQVIDAWQAMQSVARTGRAIPRLIDGQLSLDRDQQEADIQGMFISRNIVENSLSCKYLFNTNDTPNNVKVRYVDAEDDYKESEVLAADTGERFKEVQLFGVTNYPQAWREAQYLQAKIKYQNRVVSFSTELDGRNLVVGDTIIIGNEAYGWGASNGEVLDKNGLIITLDKKHNLILSNDNFIYFRDIDGTVSGPHEVTYGPGSNQVTLLSDVSDITFVTDLGSRERTYFIAGPEINRGQLFIVTKISVGEKNTTITAINYDERIYNADTGPVPTKPTFFGEIKENAPEISGLTINSEPGSNIVNVVFNPLSTFDEVRIESSTNLASWTLQGAITSGNTFSFSGSGFLYVRVFATLNGVNGTPSLSSVTTT